MERSGMRVGWAILCVTISTALLSNVVQTVMAADVAVTNGNFEVPSLAENNFTARSCAKGDPICVKTSDTVPGWRVVGVAGTWNPTAASYPGGVPQGANVAYANTGATLSQVLADILVANRRYTLQVDIGNRADQGFPGYNVQLWAGDTLLVEDDSTLTPPPGTFQTSILDVSLNEGDPGVGENLEIVLRSDGNQTNFDSVMLTADTFNVDCDNGDSLQAAIDAAGPNNVIVVQGRCIETIVVGADKVNLTLDGQGTASIDGIYAGGDSNDIFGKQITIRQFESIRANNLGIRVLGGSARIEDNENISGVASPGIRVQDASATILGNQISSFEGIIIEEGSTAYIGIDRHEFQSKPNTLFTCTPSILVKGNSRAFVHGNTIQSSCANGVEVKEVSFAEIDGNTIDSSTNGILVEGNSGIAVRDNTTTAGEENTEYGLECRTNSYVQGTLGTLNGLAGAFTEDPDCNSTDLVIPAP